MNRPNKIVLVATLISLSLLWASNISNVTVDIKNRSLKNQAANIPSQCYTKTEDADGKVHNPCFNCHISSTEPNYLDDWDLQKSYAFPEY